MLKLLFFVSVFLIEKDVNAKLFGTRGSLFRDWVYVRPISPYAVYREDPVDVISPFQSKSMQSRQQALSAPSYRPVAYSEIPIKYPHAAPIGQVPVSSTYGNPLSTNLPGLSTSFHPQTNSKPTGIDTALPAGLTAPTGTEFGIGPVSASYSNFLGTSWTANHYGSGATSGGSHGSIPAANGTLNLPFGTSAVVTSPGLLVGGLSRPPANAGPTMVSGSASLPGYNGAYYQPQTVSGTYASVGCPPSVTKPLATCLQVGPQPVSGIPGSNIVQSSTNPSNQVTYQPNNGTVLGYGTTVTSLGTNSFIPPISLPTVSSGSPFNNLGTSGSTGAINVNPQTTPMLTHVGSQSGLIGSSVSNLGSGGATGAINFIPQATLLPGSQSGLSNSQTGSISSSGVYSGGTYPGAPTATHSQPSHNSVSGFQTIVCVTPELCSHLTTQPAATSSGVYTIPADGVLCDPSGCRPVYSPISEYSESAHEEGGSKNTNESVLYETKSVSDSKKEDNQQVKTQS